MSYDVFKDPLPTSLLCKLASAIVHADEALSSAGHPLDIEAFRSLYADPEVREFLATLDALALLPVKR